MVVSCPCALVLSVPLTFFAGIGATAKSGVLVKGSNYLELLSKTKTICFDKTGTLTSGEFTVTNVVSTGEKSTEEILELVAYAESFSNHKIAKSIAEHYRKTTNKPINTAWVNGYTEVAGGGVIATIFMEQCIIGNKEFLSSNGIDMPEIDTHETVVYLATEDKLQGYVCIADTLKTDSKAAIELLKKQGLKTYMLTGDNNKVASIMSTNLCLDGYFAGLKPQDKVEKLKELKGKTTVAFVGDGINDAPVLSSASVGIAMGGLGSDIAIESADIVIMTDEPSKIVDAVKISKNTRKIVTENIIFTIGIKVLTLALVSLGLAGMWLAVFADVGVSVLAVLNSLRAMKRYNKNKLKHKKVDK